MSTMNQQFSIVVNPFIHSFYIIEQFKGFVYRNAKVEAWKVKMGSLDAVKRALAEPTTR